ncbi:MAG TPA: cellulase family glycosylhydrolase [Polyangiaceae bacterium]
MRHGLLLLALLSVAACGGSSSQGASSGDAGTGHDGAGAAGDAAASTDGGHGEGGGGGHDGSAGDAGGGDTGGGPGTDGGAAVGDGGVPAGWLATKGGGIYVSTATGLQPWMGRGVNVDDIFLCGYDNTLWMTNPDQTLETMIAGLMSGWKPNFVRISLGMDSNATVTSWLTNPAQYETPMTGVIKAIGANPGVYVLVTLRSDVSMIGQDQTDGDPEATGLPSDATSTPDKTKYPTGTDAVYQALVDSFANDAFVLFGLTNEPGGNKLTSAQISAAMSHAVGVIRAEENKLGVPHHLVSVQGNGWTSDISFYATTPLPYDDVVYEVHGYPPATASYTYPNIPVILGEYGSLTDSTSFYADVEAKQIPNLAWDFDSYSDCSPDLLTVNQSATNLVPSTWGQTVQAYLTKHAP